MQYLKTIWNYENSVGKDMHSRLTMNDKPLVNVNNRIIAGYSNSQLCAYIEEYGVRAAKYLKFGSEIDKGLNRELKREELVLIGETPELLCKLGFNKYPLFYTVGHLNDAIMPKCKNKSWQHGLTVEQLKQFAEMLDKIVMIADNPRHSDSVLLVLAYVDNDKKPIICTIKPNAECNHRSKTLRGNFVKTIFGKENLGNYYDKELQNRVLYFNNGLNKELETLADTSFVGSNPRVMNKIIRQPACLVNTNNNEFSQDIILREQLGLSPPTGLKERCNNAVETTKRKERPRNKDEPNKSKKVPDIKR